MYCPDTSYRRIDLRPELLDVEVRSYLSPPGHETSRFRVVSELCHRNLESDYIPVGA
jgi:hypothetical protein